MQEAINVGLAALHEQPGKPLVYEADGRPARGVDAGWEPLASEVPPRLPRDGEACCPLVPVFPPLGFERDWVVDALDRPDSEAARLLVDGRTAGFGSRT